MESLLEQAIAVAGGAEGPEPGVIYAGLLELAEEWRGCRPGAALMEAVAEEFFERGRASACGERGPVRVVPLRRAASG